MIMVRFGGYRIRLTARPILSHAANQEVQVSNNDRTIAAVVIPAAGSGIRMKSLLPKQFIEIRGIPILVRTILCFLTTKSIHTVAVALPAELRLTAETMLHDHLMPDQLAKLIVVNGGQTRQDSVLAGLNALPIETEVVLVHDGARPFVSREIIERCLELAADKGAVIAAIPVGDTIKEVTPSETISRTVDRRKLWQAQTPQAARLDLLRKAYDHAGRDGFQGTDEASLLEHAEIPVSVAMGSEHNIKITRPDDLLLAEGLTREHGTMKIGHGFDAHKLTTGRQLILGGVSIPFEFGLQGHSDADVLTHALIDALLGAMGEGDIGRHFPDNDSRYKDISSLKLLDEVIKMIVGKKFSIGNADITVICQQPKLAPFIEQMQNNIASACLLEPASINIKATTTEMMGYIGRGEGIAAHAVVLLEPAPTNISAPGDSIDDH